jgi:hypothetical protein
MGWPSCPLSKVNYGKRRKWDRNVKEGRRRGLTCTSRNPKQLQFCQFAGCMTRGGGCVTEDAAYRANVVGDSDGGFIVDDGDGLHKVCAIGLQLLFQEYQIGADSPLALDDVDVEVVALHLVDPEKAKLAEAERDDLVLWRQRCRVESLCLRKTQGSWLHLV